MAAMAPIISGTPKKIPSSIHRIGGLFGAVSPFDSAQGDTAG
jgi:hypothetical protein